MRKITDWIRGEVLIAYGIDDDMNCLNARVETGAMGWYEDVDVLSKLVKGVGRAEFGNTIVVVVLPLVEIVSSRVWSAFDVGTRFVSGDLFSSPSREGSWWD